MTMTNPYNKSGCPTMLPSLVCYADILGYSQLSTKAIDSGEAETFLVTLRKALSSAYSRIREHSRDRSEDPYYGVKVFTDNIVVGYPLHRSDWDYGETELADILDTFSELQCSLAMEGFFIRGGISFGEHYMDEDIVFGDALLEAVNQDKGGGAPCISLATSAVEKVRRQLGFYGDDPNWAPHHYHLLEDSDGTIFLNYLGEAFCAFPDAGVFFEVIEAHQQHVTKGLIEYKTTPGVRAKYEWLARYHNYVCRDFTERNPISTDPDGDELYACACEEAQRLLDYTIDIESLAATPRRMSLRPIKLQR
jgi:hypothetical protein